MFEAVLAGEPFAGAATVIIRLAALNEPPLRLLLGSDAVRIADEFDHYGILRSRDSAPEKRRTSAPLGRSLALSKSRTAVQS